MSKREKQDIPPAAEDGFIEFDAEVFTKAVALVKTVRDRNPIRKDMASYHITATQSQKVTISAMDATMSLQLQVPTLSVQGWGTVMIDAGALDTLLGAYREPRVKVLLDGGDVCVLKGLSSKLTLPAYDPAKELKSGPIPGPLTTSGWTLSPKGLAEAIRLTKGFTDDETTRYAMGGLLLEFPDEPNGPARIVSTDGRRISRANLLASALGQPDRRLKPATESRPMKGLAILPSKAAMMAYRLAKRTEHHSMAIALVPGAPIDLEKSQFKPGKIQVVTRDAVLTTPTQEGNFPNYRDMEAFEGEITCTVQIDNAVRLAQVLGLSHATTNSESRGVDVTIAGGSIMLETSSETKGKAQVFLSNLEMHGRATFVVDALFFRQMVDVLQHRPLEIRVHGPKDPIELVSGNEWWGLLMPLNRDEPAPRPVKPTPEDVKEAFEAADDLAEQITDSHVEGEEPEDQPFDPDFDIPVEDTLGTPPPPVAPETTLPEPSTNGSHKPAKKRKKGT